MARWGGATPADLLDDLGNSVAEQYRRVEEALEGRLRKHLLDATEAPPDLIERLRVVQDMREQAELLLMRIDPARIAEVVAQLAGEAASAEIARQLLTLPAMSGVSAVTAGGLWAIAAAEIDLRDQLRALNERILRAPGDAYQAMTAQTLPDMLAGRSTWEQVQRRQVDAYLADGIAGFIDQSGRRWRIGSYAEMATRTAAARAWRDQSVASMESHGIDTFEIVIGVDACAACAAWVGVTLSNGRTGTFTVPHALTAEPVLVTVTATVDDARAAGWGHPNCRCVLRPSLPGYTVTGTTHDPQAEAARDRMRELEREIRAAKRDGEPVTELQQALKDHTDEHGLTRRYWREQLGFTGG